jgi:hypothetical protein
MANSIISKAKVSLASILAAAMFSVSGCSQQPVEGKVCTEKACPTCADSYSEVSTVDGSDNDGLPRPDLPVEVEEDTITPDLKGEDTLDSIIDSAVDISEPATHVLTSCKLGGWINGDTYELKGDLFEEIPTVLPTNGSKIGCLNIENSNDLTIICNNFVVSGEKSKKNQVAAIVLRNSRNITFNGCNFNNFMDRGGIFVYGSEEVHFQNFHIKDSVPSVVLGDYISKNKGISFDDFNISINNSPAYSDLSLFKILPPIEWLNLTKVHFDGNTQFYGPCLYVNGSFFSDSFQDIITKVNLNNLLITGCNYGLLIEGQSELTINSSLISGNNNYGLVVIPANGSNIELNNTSICQNGGNIGGDCLFDYYWCDSESKCFISGKGNKIDLINGKSPTTMNYTPCSKP